MGGILKQYAWIANIVVILFCTYFAAKIINVYVGKALEVHRTIGVMKKAEQPEALRESHPKTDYDVIVERDIFDSSDTPASTEEGEKVAEDSVYVPGKEAIKTSLPVEVYAVLVVGEGLDSRSSTTVSMNKKDVDVYSVKGEKTFSPGVVLVQVKPDRIEFINKGTLEYAKIADEGAGSIFGPPTELGKPTAVAGKEVKTEEGAVKSEGGKFMVDQRELQDALQNLDKLYTEIRAVPNFQDGKVNGMKILSIKPGSIFSKLGLKRGDILSRINGIELDVKRGFDIFNQLKDQKSFNLDLIRGGATQTYDYDIK